MGQAQPRTGVVLRDTLIPPPESARHGYLGMGHRNSPLRPLTETINGCLAYGNGEKTFYVHAGQETNCRITLQVIEAVSRERSPYMLFCKLKLEGTSIRIEDMQIVYPGSEPDLIPMHEPPLQEWKGLGFFSIVLEHTKRIALEKGIHRITIDPDNSDLREHYAKFGFTPDPERESRMQLIF